MLASLLAAAFVAVAAYDGVVLARALHEGRQVAAASEAFEQRPAKPAASLLVVGDSTGVGTGAEDPRDSLAGRLGAALPRTRIDNLARNGARTREVTTQLAAAPQQHYDAILVQVGGNDALRFTDLDELAEAIDEVLRTATAMAAYVALMSTGDLGSAPALPWPVNALFSRRSQAVRDSFAAAAQRHGVDYVDLFSPERTDPIEEAPQRHYASDGLHLSGAGYGVWYERLRDATALPGILETSPSIDNKD